MAKNKYYAVAKGYVPGLYDTWDLCKAQVDGYSKAIYKSFTDKDDAIEFLNSYGIKVAITKPDTVKEKVNKKSKPEKIPYSQRTVEGAIRSKADVKILRTYLDPQDILDINPNAYIAFVDGSYDKDTKVYGSGVHILLRDKVTDNLLTAGIDTWGQWNIVGELEATKLAIKTAKEKGYEYVFIYHDLINISLWANGEWQAKNSYTQDYVRFIEEASKDIKIQFIKVKGHSGNIYNDVADMLANKAVKEYNSRL